MITSYEKENFVVGNEYYTYFFDISKNGKSLIEYTGIMKVKLISNIKDIYNPNGNLKFEILDSKPLSETLQYNIDLYLDGYGCSFCHFFDTYVDCVNHHDKTIIDYGKNTDKYSREKMYKKLLNTKPEKTTLENESIQWYYGLTSKQKKYVSWLSENYIKL